MFDLINGDCLAEMKSIPAGSVDMILADPPYGITACKWDSVIPLAPMWDQLNRIIKTHAVIALFGGEPFSSALRMSNIKKYKYDWKWDKKGPGGFLNAKKRPLKRYEDIIIFSNKIPLYFPIMSTRGKPKNKNSRGVQKGDDSVYGTFKKIKAFNNIYYPTDIIEISNAVNKGKVHPTQKPVPLMEYLIKTYTKTSDHVLDFTMGSGSTGVACGNLDRRFTGIELDEKYFKIAEDRILRAYAKGMLE